jgi:formyl-CoA transferase
MLAPYQAIRCADGFITIGAGSDRLFARLAGLLNHPEWASHPDFADETARVARRARLAHLIEAETIREPRATWLARLEHAGIPCGPINTYPEVFADPQILARGMVVEIDHPTRGRVRALGTPVKMSRTPPRVAGRAPLLDEHSQEILSAVRDS